MRLLQYIITVVVLVLALGLDGLAVDSDQIFPVYFTLRSGGKTLLTFIFDCGFTWGVTIPFAFISAHFTGMSILTLYLFVQLLDLTKCIVGYILIKKGIWINRLISD